MAQVKADRVRSSEKHAKLAHVAVEPSPDVAKAPGAGKTIHIVIVEDEKILAEMLGAWLESAPGFHIDGHAANARAGWEMCVAKSPDLVLVDVGLPDGDGLTLAEKVRKELPNIRVIILTGKVDPHTGWRAAQIGAHGLIDKASDLLGLRKAIAAVVEGGEFVSPSFKRIREALLAESEAFYKVLSDRELEVLFSVTEGLTDDEISKQLDISPDTVACHRKNIRKKLELHDDRSLIAYGRKWGTYRGAPTVGK